MHPDRRRAGRAIRKSRRQNREVSLRFAEFAAAARQASDAMRHFADTFSGAAVIARSTLHGIALAPASHAMPGAFIEAGAGDPSQSGVTRASGAHSASQEV